MCGRRDKWFNDGHAQAVIELTEYALARLEKAIGNMDDSNGYMSDILPELQNLHHRACLDIRPEPCALARRLFEWELKSDWAIRELMTRLNRVTEFEDYVATVRVEYKRKRNFIKLLDTFERL